MLSRAHMCSLEQRTRNAHDQNEQTLLSNSLISLMVLLNRPFFYLSMAVNVIAFHVHLLYYNPHLMLSPSHFQNSLSTFSMERVNGMPLWDFGASDFQRALKIIIIAELSILMTISSS